MKSFIIFITLGLLAAAWGLIEPYWINWRTTEIEIKQWAPDHPPLKIAVLADIHAGSWGMPQEQLAKIVDQVNATKPDLILLLGDYISHGGLASFGQKRIDNKTIATLLKPLQAPAGVVAILGNHDWYENGGIANELQQNGFQVLENEVITLPTQQLQIAALADDLTRRSNVYKVDELINHQLPVLLLAHDPGIFRDVDFPADLMLAGHTHAGQIALPFIGPIIAPSRAPRASWRGISTHHATSSPVLVSAGLGESIIPFRFFARPEIWTVVLKAPQKH